MTNSSEPSPSATMTEQWSPRQHPHILIRYEPRRLDPETGMPDDQAFEVACGFVDASGKPCGGRWRGSCTSGRIREKALAFAARHVHRDPLAAEPRGSAP